MFGKKKMTLDEIKKAYADLSDEEKKDFKQSVEDRVDESVAAQKSADVTEDSQSAEDRVDESEGLREESNAPTSLESPMEQPPQPNEGITGSAESEVETSEQQEREDERVAALVARIDALEEQFGKAMETIEKLMSASEDNDFGLTPSPSNGSENGDDERIMSSYYKKNKRAYK